MSSQEVVDYISERLNANYSKLSQICEELFMHCLAPNSDGDGTGCDNMTCIIVTFSPFRRATFKLESPQLQSTQSLKRAYENGADGHEPEKVESTGDTQSNTQDENITKKLKQESNGEGHVVEPERAS